MIPLGPPLYHYTCVHAAAVIRLDGYVRPASDLGPTAYIPWADLAWFTDLAVPARDTLGLTSHLVTCDRSEYRFTVTGRPPELVPWVSVRRDYRWAHYLETAPGARPRHWWISPVPVPVDETP